MATSVRTLNRLASLTQSLEEPPGAEDPITWQEGRARGRNDQVVNQERQVVGGQVSSLEATGYTKEKGDPPLGNEEESPREPVRQEDPGITASDDSQMDEVRQVERRRSTRNKTRPKYLSIYSS